MQEVAGWGRVGERETCDMPCRLVHPNLPGSSKKTAMARDKLLTFVAPSNPHFKVATEKGWTHLTWMAVFSEGRRRQPERNNFEVGGHGGSHAWIYCSVGWLFFLKNPVAKWSVPTCSESCRPSRGRSLVWRMAFELITSYLTKTSRYLMKRFEPFRRLVLI